MLTVAQGIAFTELAGVQPAWRSKVLVARDLILPAALMLFPDKGLSEVLGFTKDSALAALSALGTPANKAIARAVTIFTKVLNVNHKQGDSLIFRSNKQDAYGRAAPISYGRAWAIVKGTVSRVLGVGQVSRPLDLVKSVGNILVDELASTVVAPVEVVTQVSAELDTPVIAWAKAALVALGWEKHPQLLKGGVLQCPRGKVMDNPNWFRLLIRAGVSLDAPWGAFRDDVGIPLW